MDVEVKNIVMEFLKVASYREIVIFLALQILSMEISILNFYRWVNRPHNFLFRIDKKFAI